MFLILGEGDNSLAVLNYSYRCNFCLSNFREEGGLGKLFTRDFAYVAALVYTDQSPVSAPLSFGTKFYYMMKISLLFPLYTWGASHH